jgi:ABC-2 type transport system permease protein/lipopolysaccharide transport system permease protein
MTDLAVDQPGQGRGLIVTDLASIGAEPPDDIVYDHKAPLLSSLRNLWAHREIMYTLAERDFRVQYKQAALGVAWAVLSPVATLAIFVVVFSRLKSQFPTQGVPYPLYAFVGILCWSFFAGTLGNGGNSLLVNKQLLAKTQFPRECFPLETLLLQSLNTVISWIPLTILFVIYGRAPTIATVWVPAFILIEMVFAAGVTLAVSSMIIQMRDLQQVLPIIISLGIFLTPVIWPFSKIPSNYHVSGGALVGRHLVHGHLVGGHWVGGITVNLQAVYGFFNPLGPVIASVRDTMLLGHNPSWWPLTTATIGAICYLVFGYRTFKRLEVNFADIA